MRKNPKELSRTPERVEPQMGDVMADVYDSLRLVPVVHGQMRLGVPWGLRMAASDLMRFYVVAQGLAWVETKGLPAFSATAGDVLLLPTGAAHALRDAPGSPLLEMTPHVCQLHRALPGPRRFGGDGPATVVVAGGFRLLADGASGLVRRLPAVIHLSRAELNHAPWLTPLVDLVVAESTHRRPGAGVVMSRLADVLLVHALRTLAGRHDCGASPLRALGDPSIAKALELLHAEPGAPWTVERLAQKVGVSRSGLATRFAALVGEPPLQYLARWRAMTAAKRLREGSESLTSIATAVGYASDAAFSKAFKREFGSSPGAFRREAAARRAVPAPEPTPRTSARV